MSTVIYSLLIICGFIIFSIAMILAYFNWGEKIQGALASILLVGSGTIIAAIFSILKETVTHDLFPSTVVVNQKSQPIGLSTDKLVLRERTWDLSNSSQNIALTADHKPYEAFPLPKDSSEWLRFNNEAIAYDIFNTIKIISMGGSVVDMRDGTKGIHIESIRVTEDFGNASITEENFHFKYFKYFKIDQKSALPLNLPRGTIVSFNSIDNPPNNTENVVILNLKKPLFFDIQFIITSLTTPGDAIPESIPITDEEKKNIKSYSVSIGCNAKFEKFTSGNYKTQGYIDWYNSILKLIKNKYDDNIIIGK